MLALFYLAILLSSVAHAGAFKGKDAPEWTHLPEISDAESTMREHRVSFCWTDKQRLHDKEKWALWLTRRYTLLGIRLWPQRWLLTNELTPYADQDDRECYQTFVTLPKVPYDTEYRLELRRGVWLVFNQRHFSPTFSVAVSEDKPKPWRNPISSMFTVVQSKGMRFFDSLAPAVQPTPQDEITRRAVEEKPEMLESASDYLVLASLAGRADHANPELEYHRQARYDNLQHIKSDFDIKCMLAISQDVREDAGYDFVIAFPVWLHCVYWF